MKLKYISQISILMILMNISCSKEDDNQEVTDIFVSDFTASINEFPSENQIIGTIQASTNKGKLTYFITSQTPENSFTVDLNNGELKVQNVHNYNFENNPIISGIIEIKNGNISKSISVIINVENIERIYNGNIKLETQNELNNFGANRYDRINGDILLLGDKIYDTSSLSSIKFIDGYISILGTNLENIDGFQNVNLSDNHLIHIINNPRLENITGLQNITATLEVLEVRENPKIINIDALAKITDVSYLINISDNATLTNLNGLSGLNNPVENLRISNNLNLINTDGLSNIPKITSFNFTNNDELRSLGGMIHLKEIGILFLEGNNKLENIDGLADLETCSRLTIQNNVKLENLDGLNKLTKMNNILISITGNSSLRDFCGLTLISTISSTVGYTIRDNFYNPTKEDINNGDCKI